MVSGRYTWTIDDVKAHLRKFNRDRAAVPIAYVEHNIDDAAEAKDEGQKVDQRFRIHFHSKRRRTIDPDGLYSKAAIDGLRQGGLLVDDSPRYVEAVSYSQEQSEVDETIIILEPVKE